ncbi:MAG: nicotinate phosphoribosyltransferase, partial [Acidimicrobiales bacterium]
ELYFPYSPVLTVEATFAEAIVLETLVLSILNHDSAVASAAARMVAAAGERSVWEMGSRRTHEQAAVAAARSAWIAGFAGTSNLEAGRRYGIPTSGTVAHAFVMAHADERSAFAAQVASMGPGTTLLVDTYDIAQGIRTAVEVAGPDLGAIRIDSGDLAAEARRARAQLDALGAHHTRILVSGDLDEFAIEELAAHPIDAYGVGTSLVAGSGAPTADFIYKLVAITEGPDGAHPAALRSVAKQSEAKATPGGRKDAWRVLDADGLAIEERVIVSPEAGERAPSTVSGPARLSRGLQVPIMRSGHNVYRTTLEETRSHHRAARTELDPLSLMSVAGAPVLDATPTEADAPPPTLDGSPGTNR